MEPLEAELAEMLGRRYVLLTGRGTTAQVLALCAAAKHTPIQSVCIPDVICSAVLDGVLLAGLGVVLGEVSPRLTLDLPMSESVHPASNVAVLIAHTFGYQSGYRVIDNHWEHNIVTIEDVVQGVGGKVGQIGALVIVGFHETKMIPGRGGAVLTDDPSLWEALQTVRLAESCPAPAVEAPRYAAYRQSVEMRRAELLLPFNPDPGNIAQIRNGLRTLPERVRRHNAKAHWLRERLLDLPLHLPEILPGDAIWRYTFAAPDRMNARRIIRGLQRAGLRGSDNYAALSTLFQERPNPIAASYHGRLINLFVDDQTTMADLQHMVNVIHAQFRTHPTATLPP